MCAGLSGAVVGCHSNKLWYSFKVLVFYTRKPVMSLRCMHGLQSLSPPDSGTLISKGNAKLTFIREHNFGPLSSSLVLFVFSPGETLVTLSVVQEWLDTRNATAETHVLHTSVRSGS